MKQWYNGYLFDADAKDRVYNPDMVLHFVDQCQLHRKIPQKLIDDNIASDYSKIRNLLNLKTPEQNRKVIQKVITERTVTIDLISKFNFELPFKEKHFISLLFYLGMLSVDSDDEGELVLKVPNYVISGIYFDFFQEWLELELGYSPNLEAFKKAEKQMRTEGEIGPFIKLAAIQKIKLLTFKT
jgi:hypothetical protein